MKTTISPTETAVKLAISAWLLSSRRMNNLVGKLTEDELYSEVSLNRNRGVYLLGHLASINDSMLSFLGLGNRRFPELERPFVLLPDKSGEKFPPVDDLKQYWYEVNEILLNHINSMKPEEWLKKHTAVSDEDFNKDPSRNKLSILISRTNHQNYHLGQLSLLL